MSELSNVFDLSARRRSEFSPFEKTMLGDIAMDFRDQGINVRLHLCQNSLTPLAKFIDRENGELYLYVCRHKKEGAARYRVSPIGQVGTDSFQFADALIACRSYIQSLCRPKVVELARYRSQFG